jgi:hypothetical protein
MSLDFVEIRPSACPTASDDPLPVRDVSLSFMLEIDLIVSVDRAARRSRLSRAGFVWRVLLKAVDDDDGVSTGPPIRGRRGPYRPHGIGGRISAKVDRDLEWAPWARQDWA